VLVARAQSSTLQEAARTSEELALIGLTHQHLVVNGCMPESETGDLVALAIYRREQAALDAMPEVLRAMPMDTRDLLPFNLVGIAALRALLGGAISDTTSLAPHRDVTLPNLSTLIAEFEQAGHGLIMLMGKGGVGKTTLAAAIAVELAARGHAVQLNTSDPAAHLAETLQGETANLTLSRIDPRAETERYRQHVLETKGKDLDAQGRALLEEDLRSPCTEEIAVFQAFSRAIREAKNAFVVMDTAPTGHTLLLLDATGAYHREVARNMKDQSHFTTPMMQLQNQAHTRILIVTLAETTPVLEAANLQEDLRRAGIEPWAWIVNQSLAAAHPASKLLARRAEQEWPQLEAVQQRYAQRIAVVPVQAEEPVGVAALRKLSK
jgi:arsenite-transporting ATPase